MSKLLDKAVNWFDSKQTISGKLLALRQIAALIVVITFCFKLFQIPVEKIIDNEYTNNVVPNYPVPDIIPYFLVLLPTIYWVLYIALKHLVLRTMKRLPIMVFSISSNALEGLWTIGYLFIALCYFERYRVIGLEPDPDMYVLVFSILYLLGTFFLSSYSENNKIVSRVIRDNYSSPFCDSQGNPIYKDDHVYCNGLEYRFSRVMPIKNDVAYEWIIEPVYEKSLRMHYEKITKMINGDGKNNYIDLADVILSEEIEVRVKNDYWHKLRENLENYQ